jgi:hypothetical protein
MLYFRCDFFYESKLKWNLVEVLGILWILASGNLDEEILNNFWVCSDIV